LKLAGTTKTSINSKDIYKKQKRLQKNFHKQQKRPQKTKTSINNKNAYKKQKLP